jgi:hypothetical protein
LPLLSAGTDKLLVKRRRAAYGGSFRAVGGPPTSLIRQCTQSVGQRSRAYGLAGAGIGLVSTRATGVRAWVAAPAGGAAVLLVLVAADRRKWGTMEMGIRLDGGRGRGRASPSTAAL